MLDFIQNFHFLRPWFLLLLLIIPLLFFVRRRQGLTDSAWEKICDKNLLDFLLIKKKTESKKFNGALLLLILLVLPLALAGPSWQKTENPALNVSNPVVLALNMSSAMWNKDVSPSRAVRAKYLIKDVLGEINSTETGLEVYSREPFMISPISEDKSLIDNLLPAVTYDIMPEDGDRLDRAIDLAVERLKNSHYEEGNIVVLTSDVGERFDLALESAAKAADDGYNVSVIDINSAKNPKLEMVAQKGRGSYLSYNENLYPLTSAINEITDKKFRESENMQAVWQDEGYYLLFLPAFLMLYYFRRGVVLLALLMFVFCRGAQAGWFLNDNQEAMHDFEQGNFSEAAEKFENQPWKASASYKSGNFSEAEKIYSTLEGTENLYNLGNALAKSGKIEEAIAKYEEVLKQNPEHEDAKFNLEYLKQQQEQQQQNQQNQEQKQQNQQQQQGQNQQQQDGQQDQQQQSQSEKNNSEQQQQQGGEDNLESENQQQQSSADEQQSEQQSGEQQQNRQQNDKQNAEQQSEQQRQGSSQDSEKSEEQQKDAQTSQALNQAQEGEEEQKAAPAAESGADENADEKGKMLARKQKFREIKEDKGGLLRAFIKKEYNRRRYGD